MRLWFDFRQSSASIFSSYGGVTYQYNCVEHTLCQTNICCVDCCCTWRTHIRFAGCALNQLLLFGLLVIPCAHFRVVFFAPGFRCVGFIYCTRHSWAGLEAALGICYAGC
jgi:hypothetical protein